MVLELSPGWSADVDRGPDWLFIRLHWDRAGDDHMPSLADAVWRMLECDMSHRVVLDLEEVPVMYSHLIGELVRLHKRVCARGGLMRLCGVSDDNQRVLRASRLDTRFPAYPTRGDAVMGTRPTQPR